MSVDETPMPSTSTGAPVPVPGAASPPSATRDSLSSMSVFKFAEVVPSNEAAIDICSNLRMVPTIDACLLHRVSGVKVLQLIHCWVLHLPVSTAAFETAVSSRTAVDFYSFFREVAMVHVSQMQTKIGGKTVEFDETFARRRKYHWGRITESHGITIFEIYCRGDAGKSLLACISNGHGARPHGRSRRQLSPLFLFPGSQQYTGCTMVVYVRIHCGRIYHSQSVMDT